MKLARFVLKIVGLSLAAAAAVCCIIAYWDKLTNLFSEVKDCVGGAEDDCIDAEYEDYADWDE